MESKKSAETVIDNFFALKESNETAMVSYANGHDKPIKYTWKQYVNLSKRFAMYLLGKTHGNVAIHAFNCPEWFIAAMGTMCAGSFHGKKSRFFCGIYNTNRDEQCMHIIKTGDCDTLVVESYTVLNGYYNKVIDQLSKMKIKIIVINSTDRDQSKMTDKDIEKLDIINWCDLKLDSEFQAGDYPVDSIKFNSNDICTQIFTSGTTGNPKAVPITHENIISSIGSVLDRIKLNFNKERFVSYLPLSHIAGLLIDMFTPIFVRGQTHFARPDALKGSLKDTLLVVKPTLFFGVPRIWEKFMEGLQKTSEKVYSVGCKGRVLKHVFGAMKFIEKQYNTTDNCYYKMALYPLTAVSSRAVNKIKTQLGLDQCKYFATGAAPISKNVLEYFSSIDICILEIYGMSETCGVITVSDPFHTVKGSCGRPAKGVDVKIGEHDEILAKGQNIFGGYYGFEEGKSGIDTDGYLHTGDCGRFDKDGYLYITGRIKELLITAGGENIPPVLIEDKINQLCKDHKMEPQLMLVGDKKKYLSMLVFNPTEQKAIDQKAFNKIIRDYNDFHAISNSQKVQKFKVINESLTIENGLLTPTMKVKRSKVVDHYSKQIEEMYADEE